MDIKKYFLYCKSPVISSLYPLLPFLPPSLPLLPPSLPLLPSSLPLLPAIPFVSLYWAAIYFGR